MEKHVSNVGVLFIFFGGQGVFMSLVFLIMIGTGATLSGDPDVAKTLSFIGLVTIVPFLIIEALKIVFGIALVKQRPWSRIPVLILAFLSLFFPPVGTAYGAYAIWVLMKDETARLLAKPAEAK